MRRSKASYCISDAMGPLLMLSKLQDKLSQSDACFTLLFDETTTVQNKKQKDCLVRFWSENCVVTRYLSSFFFGWAPAEKIVEYLASMIKDYSKVNWKLLCNISSDGPAINLKVHRLL